MQQGPGSICTCGWTPCSYLAVTSCIMCFTSSSLLTSALMKTAFGRPACVRGHSAAYSSVHTGEVVSVPEYQCCDGNSDKTNLELHCTSAVRYLRLIFRGTGQFTGLLDNCCTVSSPPASLVSTTATEHSAVAKSKHAALPMPPAPPVTRATRGICTDPRSSYDTSGMRGQPYAGCSEHRKTLHFTK